MASATPTEYNLEWLFGSVEAWLLKSGEKKGFSLKGKVGTKVYLSCPNTRGEVYLELSEQKLSLWTDKDSLQSLIQSSRVLDLLESSTSTPLSPEYALEALAELVRGGEGDESQPDTDMDDPSDENDQPGNAILIVNASKLIEQ